MAKAPKAVAAKTITVQRAKGKTAQINADQIVSVKPSVDGTNVVVSNAGKDRITFKVGFETPSLKALAVIGGSMAAVRAHIAERKAGVKLANGLDGRNAPNCSKAVADARADVRKAAAPTKAAKPAAKAAPAKAAKAPKAIADDNRKLVVIDKKFSFGGEGTARRAAWDACVKAKTVADYIAAGGARKYLARWEKAAAIKVG